MPDKKTKSKEIVVAEKAAEVEVFEGFDVDPEFMAAAVAAGTEQGIDDIAEAGLSYVTLDKDTGDFSYRQEKLDEKVLNLVILDYAIERRYFKDKFKKGEYSAPTCFAVGLDKSQKGDMSPSSRSVEKQFDGKCSECPLGAFGGDCSPYLRLLAYKVDGDVDKATNRFKATAYHSDQLVILRVAAKSMKYWSNFVKQFLKKRDAHNNKISYPTFAYITQVSSAQCDPDDSSFYWQFKAVTYVAQKILLDSKTRRVEITECLTQEYNLNSKVKPELSEEEQAEADIMEDELTSK